MPDLYIAMGAQSLRSGRSILLGTGVFIVVVVTHSTRELLVGLNGDFHRGQKFGVGGDEGCIGSHQLFQNSLLHGSCHAPVG